MICTALRFQRLKINGQGYNNVQNNIDYNDFLNLSFSFATFLNIIQPTAPYRFYDCSCRRRRCVTTPPRRYPIEYSPALKIIYLLRNNTTNIIFAGFCVPKLEFTRYNGRNARTRAIWNTRVHVRILLYSYLIYVILKVGDEKLKGQ